MTGKQRENLKKMGGRITTVAEFLGLSPREEWLIEIKIDLGEAIRERRAARGWTQGELAEKLNLPTPKVADLEDGNPAVSVEEQLVALKELNVTRRQLREALRNCILAKGGT